VATPASIKTSGGGVSHILPNVSLSGLAEKRHHARRVGETRFGSFPVGKKKIRKKRHRFERREGAYGDTIGPKTSTHSKGAENYQRMDEHLISDCKKR